MGDGTGERTEDRTGAGTGARTGAIDDPPATPTVGGRESRGVAEACPAASSAASRPHWRRLLSGSSPREVLARLVNGDPLGVRARVARRLADHCYLMDADRVFLRAIARCARFSGRYRGQPALEEWLTERVDEALGDLLRDDLEALRTQRAGTRASGPATASTEARELGGAHEDFARPLGLDPDRMREACVAFNHTDLPARRAFFDLVIDGHSLDALARSSGASATAIARRARRALDVCLNAGEGAPASASEEQS